jgi:hypothetical protein
VCVIDGGALADIPREACVSVDAFQDGGGIGTAHPALLRYRSLSALDGSKQLKTLVPEKE